MNHETEHEEAISQTRTRAGWYGQRQASHPAPAARQKAPSAPYLGEDRVAAPALPWRWPLTSTETLLVVAFAAWLFAVLAWLQAHA